MKSADRELAGAAFRSFCSNHSGACRPHSIRYRAPNPNADCRTLWRIDAALDRVRIRQGACLGEVDSVFNLNRGAVANLV